MFPQVLGHLLNFVFMTLSLNLEQVVNLFLHLVIFKSKGQLFCRIPLNLGLPNSASSLHFLAEVKQE